MAGNGEITGSDHRRNYHPAGPDDAPAALPLPAVMMPELPPATGPIQPPAVTVLPDDNAPNGDRAASYYDCTASRRNRTASCRTVVRCRSFSGCDGSYCFLCFCRCRCDSFCCFACCFISCPIVSPGADVNPAGSVPFCHRSVRVSHKKHYWPP